MRTRPVVLSLFAACMLAACKTPAQADGSAAVATAGEDAFLTAQIVRSGDEPAAADGSSPAGSAAYAVEFVFQRADGGRLALPRAVARAAEIGAVATSPRAGSGEDGIRVEWCVQPAAGDAVSLAYHVETLGVGRTSDALREQVSFRGARRLDLGAQGLVARVPSPDGSGPLLMFARATHADAASASPAPEPPPAIRAEWLRRPVSGPVHLLRVSAVHVGRDIEPGAVLDETAAPEVLAASGGSVLRDFRLRTCLDARTVVIDVVLGPRGADTWLVPMFTVKGRDDGTLELHWGTRGGDGAATLRPAEGRRFVALGRLEGGGTAGVIVALDTED